MLCRTIVLLTLCVVYLCEAADPVLTPQTLTDSVLNTADSNSNIVWSDLPEGQTYKTDATYDDGGMGPLFDFARNFINTVFSGGFPYDFIVDVKDGNFDVTRDYMQVLSLFGGYAAAIVIGFLFIIIFTIVGCCFCCCRCCGNCGGKMLHKSSPSTSCRRKVYSVILLVLVVFTGVGCICIYVSNDRMTTAIGKFDSTVGNNLDDVDLFLNNTVTQVKRLLDNDLNFTFDVLFRDLDNVDVLVGIPVRDKFDQSAGINAIFTQVGGLQTDVNTVISKFDTVDSDLTNLKSNFSAFKTDLDNWITDYETTRATCPDGPSVCNLFINGSNLSPPFDPNNIDISSVKTEIDNVRSQDMSSLVQTAKDEFNGIPERVKNDSASTIQDLKTTVTNYKGEITPIIDTIEKFQTDASGSLNIEDIKKLVTEYSDLAKPYDKYRWYGGVGLTSIVLLVVLLEFLGLAFGVCGSSSDTLPTERSCLSNAGGNMLMAAVGFIFIFSWLLMFLTTLTFLIGAPAEKFICEPLSEPELETIQKLIDNFGLLGSGNESYLGKTLLNDPNVDLKIGTVLKDCGDGKTAYTAFKLKYMSGFNLSIIQNYKSQLDIDSKLNSFNVDFSTIEVAPASLKDNMQNFKNSITNMNFTSYTEELNKNVTGDDLTAFITGLTAAINAASPSTFKTDMTTHRDDLITIRDGSFSDAVASKNTLASSMSSLETSVGGIPTKIDTLLASLNTTQEFLNTNGSTVLTNVLRDFVLRVFTITDALVNRAISGLENDVAKCTPVYNLYQSVVVIGFCKYVIDAFNGFWFCIGWCLFFFVPSTIFSVKLAKHFRRMKQLDMYDATLPTKNDDHNMIGGRNKVGHSDKF
ncbi:prominin-1-A isoform X2 [Patella vulgata]|uniref:prominin-1-A isoform X2 n=1 Tax=Patella vulgata TaxID=6465 RepID=UPI00218003E7|nr:prominin-1-A isoform X2 [Patella vulgata]